MIGRMKSARWVAALSSNFMLMSQAAAQQQITKISQVCEVVEAPGDKGSVADKTTQPKWLNAVCGDQGVWIGNAAAYESAYNAALRSLVVVLHDPGRVRVLMVSQSPTGIPNIDDVTRQLAAMAGRLADEGLGNIAVDLSSFATLGRVAVPVATQTERALRRGIIHKSEASASEATAPVEKAVFNMLPHGFVSRSASGLTGGK